MAGVAYISRWTIPTQELRAEFCKDWWEAEAEGTKQGNAEAVLYHVEPDSYIAITRWPSAAEFERSRWGAGKARNEKWRSYCVSGPEEMTSIIELRQ